MVLGRTQNSGLRLFGGGGVGRKKFMVIPNDAVNRNHHPVEGCSQVRLGTPWAPESGPKMHGARKSPAALGKLESCTEKALGTP